MRNLSSPEQRAAQPGPGARRPRRRRWRRWPRCRRSCSATWPTRSRALNRDPAALQETIEETPPTLAAATASFRVQTPFLARFADVSRRLQPGAAELRRSLPLINAALAAGVPPSGARPSWASDLAAAARGAGERCPRDPNTLLALKDLRPRAPGQPSPAIEHIAPYQTVCNYLVYFFNPLGTHLSETVPGGTQERIKAKLADLAQANTLGADRVASGRWTCRPTRTRRPGALQALHAQYRRPAIDSKGAPTARAGRPATPTGW